MTAELAPSVGNTLLREIMEVLISEGTQGFRPVLEALLNETMKIDRERHRRSEVAPPSEAQFTGYPEVQERIALGAATRATPDAVMDSPAVLADAGMTTISLGVLSVTWTPSELT